MPGFQEEMHPRDESGKFAVKAEAAQKMAEASLAKESEVLSKLYRAKAGPPLPAGAPGIGEEKRAAAIAQGQEVLNQIGGQIKNQTIKDLFSEGRWDLKAQEVKRPFVEKKELFEITIAPRPTETTREIVSPWSEKPMFYDEQISEIGEDGYPKLREDSGYSNEFPEDKGEEGFIYRGVGFAEYKSMIESGSIQSAGTYNIGDGQVGLTYFADRGSTAAQYAGGYQPYHKLPTFEEPSYVVKIARPPDELLDTSAAPEGEIGVRGSVPTSEIVSVFEVRPYSIKPGMLELRTDMWSRGEYKEGSRSSPNVSIGYKKIYDSRASGAVPEI